MLARIEEDITPKRRNFDTEAPVNPEESIFDKKTINADQKFASQ